MFEAHFQTFEEAESGVALTARLGAFREELARRKLTGFVIPRADQQQNEYVAPSEERLAWLTGFTGSAGMAIVLTREAAVFVDGRYTLQAGKQVDRKAWQVEPLVDPPPEHWLTQHLAKGDRLGFDPWLHTSSAAERLAAACAKAGAELVAVDSNPVDTIWHDRPAPPLGPVCDPGQAIRRRDRGREAEAHPARDQQARRRCAGAVGFPRRGLDLQHPRRRRLAYAAAAVLRAGAEGRPADRSSSTIASSPTRSRDHLEQSADVEEPDKLAPKLTELAKRGAVDCARQRHRGRCAEPA